MIIRSLCERWTQNIKHMPHGIGSTCQRCCINFNKFLIKNCTYRMRSCSNLQIKFIRHITLFDIYCKRNAKNQPKTRLKKPFFFPLLPFPLPLDLLCEELELLFFFFFLLIRIWAISLPWVSSLDLNFLNRKKIIQLLTLLQLLHWL